MLKKVDFIAQEYKEKYIECPHLYYGKDFFYDFAKKYGYNVIFFETPVDAYPMSLFRFHVLIEKV